MSFFCVGVFCLLGSVFASLVLDFLGRELAALTAADWAHPHAVNVDKAGGTEGCKYSSLIGPFDNSDSSLCCFSHCESNSKN